MSGNIGKKNRIDVFCIILGIIFIPGVSLNDVYAGNGMYPLGLGPRAVGRGGADIAVADETLGIINLNPAGMTRIEGRRFDLGGSIGALSTHFENDYNDRDGDPIYFFLPSFGYVNHPTDKPWAYGISLSTPAGAGTSYSLRHPLYEKKMKYENSMVSIKISPALAYQVNPRMSIGFAPSLSYNRLDAEMPFSKSKEEVVDICQGIAYSGTETITFGDLFNDFPFDEFTPLSKLKNMHSLSYGFSFGILFEVNPRLTIGLSYVSRQKFDLKGKIRINANRYLELNQQMDNKMDEMLELLPNQGTEGFIGEWDARAPFTFPQRVGLGMAYRPRDRILLAFDAAWIDWPDFLGEWVMKMSDGDNEDLNALIGARRFRSGVPQNWKDGIIFSLGVEYELTRRVVLRAGFAHGNSIVPSNTVVPLGPALNENHLTLGWGYQWKSRELNLAYEHIFRNSSSRVKHKVASEFDYSKVSVSANILHIMYTWHF